MRITSLGHAGFYIETAKGSILCDPFFNPAYFGSWYPFPANDQLDVAPYLDPDYLYLSHTHLDHFDEDFLRDRVSKDVTVLLPDHPLGLVEKWLRQLGFEHFVQTKNAVPVDLGGLKVMICALVAPADGPLGDSGLCIDDGEVKLFDQNDSRPVEFAALEQFGPYDVHLLQYSGAIWYPMVYRFPQKMKDALSAKKRRTQMERALRYAQQIGAPHIVPSAGPPCFLDDDLYYLNDFNRDPTNIFPDATVFLELVAEAGFTTGHLMIPGSVMEVKPGANVSVTHPLPAEDVRKIFTEKRAHIDAYKARQQAGLDAIKATWPRGQVEILPALKEWLEPVLELADQTSVGVDERLLLDLGPEKQIVIDFIDRKVHAWDGEECKFRFIMDPALVEYCIIHHEEDWVNHIFLSCRFEAERRGQYNEFLYSFFKCLSPERIEYAEGYYVEQRPDQQLIECEGYLIQRRCPHLKADLTRFGEVDGGVLTCTLHGWQFDLATGKCLTSDDRKLFSKKIEQPAEAVGSDD